MTVTIDKREYVLSQRRAADVLELAVAVEKGGHTDSMGNVLTMARIIRDSLKASYLDIGRVRGWRYRQFLDSGGVMLLLESLSLEELATACRYVVEELEGSKKKQPEAPLTASVSAETSPAGS